MEISFGSFGRPGTTDISKFEYLGNIGTVCANSMGMLITGEVYCKVSLKKFP